MIRVAKNKIQRQQLFGCRIRAPLGPYYHHYKFSTMVNWSINESTKVGTITLNSPDTYNALTVEMGVEFQTLMKSLQKDFFHKTINVNAIVLQGAGGKAFSAGGNTDWLKSLKDNSVHENADQMINFYTSFLCMRRLIPVPVIAALNGPAMGAGACLALACDLRVASNDANKKILGFPFSKLGIHVGMGGSWLLQHNLANAAMVNEILLTGKTLNGLECMDLKLVNQITDTDNVQDQAYEMAVQISEKHHPVAIRSMIQTLRVDNGLNETLQREALAQAMCYARNDWGEGVDAVVQKRDANFDDYSSH